MALSQFVIFAVLLLGAFAEIKTFRRCNNISQTHCKVTQVRIDPCRAKGHCILEKGTNASMSFDFTPNFAAGKLKTEVVYPSSGGEIPFADMSTDDGCTLTTCPTVAGVSQTLNYNLYIGKKLPTGIFPFLWKLRNEDNADEICCFKISVELVKK